MSSILRSINVVQRERPVRRKSSVTSVASILVQKIPSEGERTLSVIGTLAVRLLEGRFLVGLGMESMALRAKGFNPVPATVSGKTVRLCDLPFSLVLRTWNLRP